MPSLTLMSCCIIVLSGKCKNYGNEWWVAGYSRGLRAWGRMVWAHPLGGGCGDPHARKGPPQSDPTSGVIGRPEVKAPPAILVRRCVGVTGDRGYLSERNERTLY